MILFDIFTGDVSFFQHPRDGIRNGQHQTAILKNRILAADTFELVDDFINLHPGAQGKGNQAPDGLGLGGGRTS